MTDEPQERAAALYAAALRKALAGFIASGGTQKEIAAALNVAPATLSRYLSGERIAPRTFLHALRGHLEARAMPWTQEVYENLDALCGKAHTASRSPAVQLAQLKEEVTRLQREQQQAHQVGEARLADLERQTAQLARQLQEALERARSAEGSRERLTARVKEQDESLRHAQDYIHQVEAELAQQREEARRLRSRHPARTEPPPRRGAAAGSRGVNAGHELRGHPRRGTSAASRRGTGRARRTWPVAPVRGSDGRAATAAPFRLAGEAAP
ncbi:helix-turn-helix transcriptional regulator [Streptomyces sp. A1136]|uniref:helix-turn-helix domain-containing protein n=1 Tax=Streptomyces sp. A1136 TaxID=2563102 RepID=UPI00109E5159|nr:helix-turn-helix transcriptional regulator [Streptomyces sp. A1136]THA44796.1 helix-turn-helix domain-containing protein [Streptomyces sp. A1136]